MELKPFKDYIETFPEADSPEISGLHPNAELTFRINEVNAMIATLGETQPKGGGGGGESIEDAVTRKATELISRLPEEYNEDDYKHKINKLGGLTIPLNIFLFQEIQRLPARAVETGDQGRGRPDGRTGPGPGCDWRRARASFLDLHAVRHGVFLDPAVARPVVLVTPRAR